MPKGFYRELAAILKDNGCRFVRYGKGDHEIWYSPVSGRTFTVDRSVRSRFTANGVLKEAGLSERL